MEVSSSSSAQTQQHRGDSIQSEIYLFHKDQDVKPMQPHLQVKYLEFKMLFLSMKS